MKIVFLGLFMISELTLQTYAQKMDDERMNRDIEVAENVLSTLIKQRLENRSMFFPLDIEGSYQEGYGVTFTLPAEYTTPIAFTIENFDGNNRNLHEARYHRYHFRDRNEDDENEENAIDDDEQEIQEIIIERNEAEADGIRDKKWKLKEKNHSKSARLDSIRDTYNQKLVEASKDFLADYGDIISQLGENERIVITNRGDRPRTWLGNVIEAPGRTYLSIETTKGAISQFKQGKLTRAQLLDKIKIVNAETIDEVDQDLELLSSIFNRLYRADLSKTYFIDGNVYYERLKDFGAVYYMQVFSSTRTFNGRYDLPTLNLRDLNQEERDQKIKELYPVFEKQLVQNILEYGRTVKSLGDTESLIFNVKVTQCNQCNIPAALEVAVKGAVLKDFNNGKLDRSSAAANVTVKRTEGR